MAFIKYTTGVTNYSVEYMECKCMSTEHLVKFHLDLDDGDLCMDVHLANWLPWYKRLGRSIKYLFGYKSKYGDFDNLIFKEEDVDNLMKLLVEHKRVKQEETKDEGLQ